MPRPPDPRLAAGKYRLRAHEYDATARRTMRLRERAHALLDLRPGETVLDAGCGTGLSLPALAAAVGPAGRVFGFDVSGEMLGLARRRVAALGNVALMESPAEDVALPGKFQAALFFFTHDVLQSPRALERLFSHAAPGARVVLAGAKHPSRWLLPLRLYRLLKARPWVTTLHGLDRPWAGTERYLPGLEVRPAMLGTVYLASGRTPA